MLDELVVRNLGVIDEARLEPGPGLVVVTGETGAGKTLLLGALRTLLGDAARPDLVGPFGEEAVVEGRFLHPQRGEVAAARRMPRDGRSRAYLDGVVASAAALEEATAGLVEIVGQHDQLSLTRPQEARLMLDRLLSEAGREAFAAYREAWQQVQQLHADRDRLGGDRRALERERDLLGYQVGEIAAAGFRPGDDRELEQRAQRLRHAETLREQLATALAALEAAGEETGRGLGELRRAQRLDPGLQPTVELAGGVEAQLGELLVMLRTSLEELDTDPAEAEATERRVAQLADLRRKYGHTLDEVLVFGEQAAARLQELESLLQRADRIDREVAAAEAAMWKAAEQLREARREAAERLQREAVRHLRELGFNDPLVRVAVEAGTPQAGGADEVRIEFASDRRLRPGEVGKVASGGELSRLVLSLRLAAGAGSASTLAFDEVDAGVGGATALALGRKLAALAEGRQVLCVTHLPQVAAFADTHYVVERTGTTARVSRVEGAARLEELSRMLAGLPDSERGREAAAELLELAAGG